MQHLSNFGLVEKQGKGCDRLLLFSHLLVPGTASKDRNQENN